MERERTGHNKKEGDKQERTRQNEKKRDKTRKDETKLERTRQNEKELDEHGEEQDNMRKNRTQRNNKETQLEISLAYASCRRPLFVEYEFSWYSLARCDFYWLTCSLSSNKCHLALHNSQTIYPRIIDFGDHFACIWEPWAMLGPS